MDARMQKLRMAWWLGRLFVVLSLMSSWGAQAAIESVAPLSGGTTWKSVWWEHRNLEWPSAEAFCTDILRNIPPWWYEPPSTWAYLGTTPNATYYAAQGMLDCNYLVTPNPFYPASAYKTANGGVYPWPFPTCPVPTIHPEVPYGYNALHNMCERTAQETCPIPPLTPLTDPVAIDFENGTRWRPDGMTAVYQEHLRCVETAIAARGGSSVGTSAYRPTQYQQHLFEIVDKDFKLSRSGYMSTHPECQALRDEITRAMGPPPGHRLRRNQPVAAPGTSRHESGTAFDLTPIGLTDAQMTLIYAGCGVSHTAVSGEPWHVQ